MLLDIVPDAGAVFMVVASVAVVVYYPDKKIMFSVAFVCLFVCLYFCLSVCLFATLLKMLWTDSDEISWRGPGWVKRTSD